MKIIRLIVITLVIITLALPIVAFAALSIYGIDQLKPLLIAAVEKKTGRTLVINGDMHATLALTPTITITDMRLSNPSWANQQDMLAIDEAQIILDLPALLQRRIAIDDVHLRGGSVYLQQKDEQQNWLLTPASNHSDKKTSEIQVSGTSQTPNKKIVLDLDKINLEKITLIYQRNNQKPHRIYISRADAEIAPDMSAVVHFTYQDGIKGRLTIDSETSDIAELLTTTADMQLHMEAPQSSMVIAGKASSLVPLDFIGTVKADSASLHHLLSIIYAKEIQPTSAIAWESQVTVKNHLITADAVNARYGNTQANGNIAIDISHKTPHIIGNFLIPRFTIATTPTVVASNAQSTQPQVQVEEKNQQSIDFNWLNHVNGNLKLQIASLMKDNTEIASNIMFNSTVNDKILSITDYRGRLFDGTFSGNATLDTTNEPLHLTLKTHIYDISVEKISQFLSNNSPWRGGALDAEFAFATTGDNKKQILHNLDGTVSYTLAKTQFITPDKAREVGNFINALRGKQTEGRTIDIQCGIGTWNIEQGKATADIALLDTASAIVDIRGFIHLVSKELSLTVFAHPKHNALANIPIPIRVTGTLNDLKMKPDSQALLRSFGNVLAVLKEKSESISSALGSSLAERLKQKDVTHTCFAEIPTSLTNPQPTTKKELKQIEKDVKKDFKEIENSVRDVRDNLKVLFGE